MIIILSEKYLARYRGYNPDYHSFKFFAVLIGSIPPANSSSLTDDYRIWKVGPV